MGTWESLRRRALSASRSLAPTDPDARISCRESSVSAGVRGSTFTNRRTSRAKTNVRCVRSRLFEPNTTHDPLESTKHSLGPAPWNLGPYGREDRGGTGACRNEKAPSVGRRHESPAHVLGRGDGPESRSRTGLAAPGTGRHADRTDASSRSRAGLELRCGRLRNGWWLPPHLIDGRRRALPAQDVVFLTTASGSPAFLLECVSRIRSFRMFSLY